MDHATTEMGLALARADRHVRDHAGPDVEFQLDARPQQVLGDRVAVHGRQHHRGIPLEPHSFVVDLDGSRAQLHGDAFVAVGDVNVVPRRGAAAAVAAAFSHLRGGSSSTCAFGHAPLFKRRRYRPRVTAVFPLPAQPTVFPAGPFHEPVTASLILHVRDGNPALAWLVGMAVTDVADFAIIVDATTAAVLACAADCASAVCFADVVLFDPRQPAVRTRFPRPLTDYSPGIRPTTDFAEWIARDELEGNNVEMLYNNRPRRVRARPVGANLDFLPATDVERQLVNAFFLCNFMHDFFSLVGFDEAHGNFQMTNVGTAGVDGDRLLVNILPTAVGRANMRAQKDGQHAELRLGTINGRAAAFDASIVIHEFAHGVSQRLVGGPKEPQPLTLPQSVAMGEGWSDYFAITILNSYRPLADRSFVIAPWAFGSNAGGRLQPYDATFSAHYGNIMTDARYREQHEAGSIFAAALLRMHAGLVNLLGDTTGNETGWRLVVASMKLLNPGPHFLDGRRTLLAAATALPLVAGVRNDIDGIIRAAFAARGMGSGATTADATFSNIHADFNP